jgi:inosine-uridine nucleoside N-ribohydrolase
MPKKIIIDTDPGVDDAMAILFAFNAPEIEVVGLTTIYGNVQVDLAAQNALRLVELAGHPDVPVAKGTARPLLKPLDRIADFVHGVDGFGNINQPPPTGQPINRSAAQFIVDTIMANPGEITLVPIGPLTNIALALALEPQIIHNVAEVVVMGGAATVSGNVNPAAEANIFNDPHAADRVFTAGWPLTMVGLDVTMKTVMTDEYLVDLKATGSKICEFIYDISRFYLEFHRQHDGVNGLRTHDPSAIAYVVDPSLFTTQPGVIRVVTEGIAAGQTVMDQRGAWHGSNPWSNISKTNVCLDVASEMLLEVYQTIITKF